MKSRFKSPLFYASVLIVLGFLIAATTPKYGLYGSFLQSNMDGNQQCITNLACIQAGTGTFNNINATNATINNLTVSNINNVSVNNLLLGRISTVDMMAVIDMATNLFKAGTPNEYWIDWGHTNSLGQTNIYASLAASSDVKLHLPTNGIRGSLMSFNIVAVGGNRTITIETNMPHFDTNGGFALSGSLYSLLLTNGCELRMSMQSNQTMSTIWRTFGQP
jgi:hypothetical protein